MIERWETTNIIKRDAALRRSFFSAVGFFPDYGRHRQFDHLSDGG
jgi:hypothetical protein